MKLKKLNRKDQGFTIIEVMIVLAIAALIMLIVFLAVPNLQRNSRNTGRKSDAGRVGTAATNFVSNNNGTLPGAAADAGTILTDAGNLSQYASFTGGGAAGNCVAASWAATKLNICKYNAAATLSSVTANQDALVLATGASCGNGGAIAQGTAREMALYYTIETSGGTPAWSCLQL